MRSPLVALWVLAGVSGCARCNAPELPDGPALAPPPPPPAVVVRDAGTDAVDAAPDGPPAPPHHAAKKAAPSAPSGGGGTLKVDGPLARADADKVVHAGAAKMRACYETAHAGNPALKGRATFQLTVDARGRVTLGEVVTSTLGDSDPEMCMIRATRDFKFPPASGESKVTFPMSFGR